MPIRIVRGPAGGGKSQWIRERMGPSDVLLDYTTLWAAVTGAERDAAGKFPIRRDGDPRLAMVEWLRIAAVRQAAERELDGLRHHLGQSARSGRASTGCRGDGRGRDGRSG